MNNIRGSRGGSGNRPSRQDKPEAVFYNGEWVIISDSHKITSSVLAMEAGKYYECSQLEDRSLTKRLHLRLWDNGFTLLRRGKPVNDTLTLIRETSKGKRRVEIEEEIG